jgi:hypothetical protein
MVGCGHQRHLETRSACAFYLKLLRETSLDNVLTGSALGAAHLLLLGSLGFTATGWKALSIVLDINRFGTELLLYGFVFGITGITQFQIRAQRDAMQALELQRQLSTAHLQALQMQLEPHFSSIH